MNAWWILVAVGLGALAGCGGDGGDGANAATGSGADRYCKVTDQLDEASDRLISAEADTPEKVQAGFARLFEDFGRELDDLVAAAPAEIKADVAKGVEAFRKAADGDFSALKSFDDSKISDFDAKNCS